MRMSLPKIVLEVYIISIASNKAKVNETFAIIATVIKGEKIPKMGYIWFILFLKCLKRKLIQEKSKRKIDMIANKQIKILSHSYLKINMVVDLNKKNSY